MKHSFRIWIAMAALLAALSGCSGEDPATPENNPPVLPAQGDLSAAVGTTVRLTFQATDRDGDAIRYHLTVFIGGISDPLPDARINAESGEFVFMPAESDKPSRTFMVDASDGRGGKATVQFVINVTD